MISLALDAWTSSNNYAFLAIMAHYINKKGELGEHNSLYFNLNTDLTLEELLINFHELVGGDSYMLWHSGLSEFHMLISTYVQ